MKLQVGKTYVTRDGRTAKVEHIEEVFPAHVKYSDGKYEKVTADGRVFDDDKCPSGGDLIAESEPPAESTSRGGDVVGDLRALVADLLNPFNQLHPTFHAWANSVDRIADDIASRLAQQGGTGAHIDHAMADAVIATNSSPPQTAGAFPTADQVSVPREATEAMNDDVRYVVMYLCQPQRTYGGLREHVRLSYGDTTILPEFAIKAGEKEHIAKAGVSMIIWHVMVNSAQVSAPAPSPAGESRAVVLPGAKTMTLDMTEHSFIRGWNTCRNELLRLNPWLSPTTGDAREGQGDG